MPSIEEQSGQPATGTKTGGDRFDIVVVGGGMAGLSIGAELAQHARVLVLEAEEAPGYHATGRAVAFWLASYGGPLVQPLTSASGPMLADPDPAFSDSSFLSPRGALHIGTEGQAAEADAFADLFASQGVDMRRVGREVLADAVPGLCHEWTMGVAEPGCRDIDVTALLHAYRRQFLHRGGVLRCGQALWSAARDGAGWRVETAGGPVSCAVLVNAGGAWVDEIAARCGVAPIGIRPLRRTVVQVRTSPAAPPDLPLILDLSGQFYFKSVGGGRLWLTPHDEQWQAPGDAAPDEVAVATAIERFRAVVGWDILAIERKWAGLRSFVSDRAPVYGFDRAAPGFFWFAGQGGFGIQTAPAAALIGAALVTGNMPDSRVSAIDIEPYGLARLVTEGV